MFQFIYFLDYSYFALENDICVYRKDQEDRRWSFLAKEVTE